MNNRYGNIHPTANTMADEFELHAIYFSGEACLTMDGYKQLQKIYEEVLPEQRASVFNDFLKELSRRNIPYNVEDFKQGK